LELKERQGLIMPNWGFVVKDGDVRWVWGGDETKGMDIVEKDKA
jgi:hypothetical protein